MGPYCFCRVVLIFWKSKAFKKLDKGGEPHRYVRIYACYCISCFLFRIDHKYEMGVKVQGLQQMALFKLLQVHKLPPQYLFCVHVGQARSNHVKFKTEAAAHPPPLTQMAITQNSSPFTLTMNRFPINLPSVMRTLVPPRDVVTSYIAVFES